MEAAKTVTEYAVFKVKDKITVEDMLMKRKACMDLVTANDGWMGICLWWAINTYDAESKTLGKTDGRTFVSLNQFASKKQFMEMFKNVGEAKERFIFFDTIEGYFNPPNIYSLLTGYKGTQVDNTKFPGWRSVVQMSVGKPLANFDTAHAEWKKKLDSRGIGNLVLVECDPTEGELVAVFNWYKDMCELKSNLGETTPQEALKGAWEPVNSFICQQFTS